VREVSATPQCAGGRRAGLMAVCDIPGEAPWVPGATGTATWTAVALAGLQSRGAARRGNDRAAAPARPRRAAAGGRARLYRRAQRQVARADRGARVAVGGVFPARRLPAAAGGRDAGPGRGYAARAGRAKRPTCCLQQTGRRSSPAQSMDMSMDELGFVAGCAERRDGVAARHTPSRRTCAPRARAARAHITSRTRVAAVFARYGPSIRASAGGSMGADRARAEQP
jgi:hypothetical protein